VSDPAFKTASKTPRLIDQVRAAIRVHGYSRRTEKAYVAWIRRYVRFHGTRHPVELGEAEVSAFLTCLAVERKVSASTQNQALSAILFLYRKVLKIELGWLGDLVHDRRPARLPVVLARSEVTAILEQLNGTPWLMASLLYGAGLRVLECSRLRVKDIDLNRREIVVRDGKGRRDRVTLLPELLRTPLGEHLERVRSQHQKDLARGFGSVELPTALERKYPRAPWQWGWQWIFPGDPGLPRPRVGTATASSPARIGAPEGRQGCGPGRRCFETRHLPHLASLVRHPSARGWL
jgi:integron integrase